MITTINEFKQTLNERDYSFLTKLNKQLFNKLTNDIEKYNYKWHLDVSGLFYLYSTKKHIVIWTTPYENLQYEQEYSIQISDDIVKNGSLKLPPNTNDINEIYDVFLQNITNLINIAETL